MLFKDYSEPSEAPIRLATRTKRNRFWAVLCCLNAMGILAGCKSSATEIRGKSSFGPEFRNRGNNTSEIRYAAQQGIDVKWDNGWTTGITYRRRDVDEGSGDNENRVLFEVSYPLWKAPKKPDKTADRVEELQEEVRAMRARVAALNHASAVEPVSQFAHVHNDPSQPE